MTPLILFFRQKAQYQRVKIRHWISSRN